MAKITETTHSKLFEKYRDRFNRGGCTKEQLKKLVKLSAITATEYEEITGEAYEE